jgi:hypothetical protein
LGYGNLTGVSTSRNSCRGFRFPAEIIEQAVWLYHCVTLSLRVVELILAACGVLVSCETFRAWGIPFWAAVRLDAEAAPATARRQVVHGRDVHPHSRQAARSLARGGSRRQRVRHRCAEPARCQSGQAIYLKFAEGLARRSTRDRDRQAMKLHRRQARYPARCGASAEPLPQQPGGGIAPTDRALQVHISGAALSVQSQPDPQSFPASPACRFCSRVPLGPRRCIPHPA